ncbi:hypothetical protein HUJ04_002463 [Dendroctonus ponderosae]
MHGNVREKTAIETKEGQENLISTLDGTIVEGVPKSTAFSWLLLLQHFTVDHPCIFLVRSHDEEHSTSGFSKILFIGKLSNEQVFIR